MAERLLVVGGGTMGSGIGLVGARAGYDVEIVEPDAAARERAFASLEREAQRLGDASLVERIRWSDAVAACDASMRSRPFPSDST